jgi:hypothetical protein
MRAVWAGSAGKAVFREWADDEHARISATMGGDLEASEKDSYMKFAHGKPGVSVNVHGECGRKGNRRIQLDDLLSISEDGRLPFTVSGDAVYVPMIWDELTRRLHLNWFLRMSEEQIMESELVVKWLLAA